MEIEDHVEIEDQRDSGRLHLNREGLVHQFCIGRIGRHAFSRHGKSPLNQFEQGSMPPFVLASGNLARPYGLNREGLRRAGFSEETMEALSRAYKLLVRVSGGRSEDEIQQLAGQYPEVEQMRAGLHRRESPRHHPREKFRLNESAAETPGITRTSKSPAPRSRPIGACRPPAPAAPRLSAVARAFDQAGSDRPAMA